MPLDHDWIEHHIPHHGRMCLLDAVLSWDDRQIACRSGGHRALDHPMRAHGRLSAACGIEYAAQSMAVHGALTGGARETTVPAAPRPAAGFLASVRGVRLRVPRLDDIEGDLVCRAVRTAGDEKSALYEFELRSATMLLLDGRATVVLDAGTLLNP